MGAKERLKKTKQYIGVGMIETPGGSFFCVFKGLSEKERKSSHECGKKGYAKMEVELRNQLSSTDRGSLVESFGHHIGRVMESVLFLILKNDGLALDSLKY
ncbi:hypothetical protein J2W91_005757 [Paenibacillus amylolyticus]|uniref:Uncharacterized protein n=1 Tax=Paenibacillus amylolyticus TaxID=1451 RepID=A0AAP5HB25_PAEAM|nr:hypothetical protein [Paenibacillus amylolyticus]MDR6727231.1 hypothetical protein [Paenibacillus amylolyticus]